MRCWFDRADKAWRELGLLAKAHKGQFMRDGSVHILWSIQLKSPSRMSNIAFSRNAKSLDQQHPKFVPKSPALIEVS